MMAGLKVYAVLEHSLTFLPIIAKSEAFSNVKLRIGTFAQAEIHIQLQEFFPLRFLGDTVRVACVLNAVLK